MTIIFTSAFFTIDHDNERHLLRVTRSAEKIEVSTIDAAFGAMGEAIGTVHRAGLMLLIDLRHGPSNNDPALEQAMRAPINRVTAGFRKHAILLRSAAGVLQASRLQRQSGDDAATGVFRDEGEALAWLAS